VEKSKGCELEGLVQVIEDDGEVEEVAILTTSLNKGDFEQAGEGAASTHL
jgi:hypothetical protein